MISGESETMHICVIYSIWPFGNEIVNWLERLCNSESNSWKKHIWSLAPLSRIHVELVEICQTKVSVLSKVEIVPAKFADDTGDSVGWVEDADVVFRRSMSCEHKSGER